MSNETSVIIERIKQEEDIVRVARLMLSLKTDYKMRTKDIAQALSMQPSYVCNVIRILQLPEIVTDGYYAHVLSIGHLVVLSRLRDKNQATEIYEQILSKDLTVAKTEELVREALYKVKTVGERIDQGTKMRLKNAFKRVDEKVDVKVIQTRIGAKIELSKKGSMKETSAYLKKLAKVV